MGFVAGDGGQILAEIEREDGVDLLVFDLEMPDVDSSKILEKTQKRRPPLPVVIHTFLTEESEQIIGFLTVCRHFPESAEIYVMAVHRMHHRLGIGRRLIESAEAWLLSEGVRYLQVKTLSTSHPDPNYASTRRFYERMGFSPIEELKTLWDPSNPCLLLVKTLAPSAIGP